MCWLTKTFAPTDSATVFLRCGADPEHRRRQRPTRVTGSGRVAARAAQHQFAVQQRRARWNRPRGGRSADCGRGTTSARPRAASSASRSSVQIGSSRQVAARRHDREPEVGQQQVVERRAGQHHAEVRVARGDRVGDGRPVAPGRRLRAAAGRWAPRATSAAVASSSVTSQALRADCVERREHQRERLLLARLRLPQPAHRLAVRAHRRRGGIRRGPSPRRSRPAADAIVGGLSERLVARRRAPHRPASHSSSCGPQAGQAFGCAWKRRSLGS